MRWEKWINYATNALISISWYARTLHTNRKNLLFLRLLLLFLFKRIETEKSLIATSVLNFMNKNIERDIFLTAYKEFVAEPGAN